MTASHIDGGFIAQNSSLKIAVPADRGKQPAEFSGEVIMGIRPEDVTISADVELDADIFVVEPLGREDLIDVRVGENSILLLANPEENRRQGERVKVHMNTTQIQFFDPKTEKSLLWV